MGFQFYGISRKSFSDRIFVSLIGDTPIALNLSDGSVMAVFYGGKSLGMVRWLGWYLIAGVSMPIAS